MKELIATTDSMGLEPKPESLWWTSTSAQERNANMNLIAKDKIFTFPFEMSGRGIPSLEASKNRMRRKSLVQAHIYRSKSVG